MSQKPTLNNADINLLNKILDARFNTQDQRLNERFETQSKLIDRRFEKVDKRFETIDKQFEKVDKRFETMDKRFETIDKQFEKVDKRFETMDKQFEKVDKRFDQQNKSMENRLDNFYEGIKIFVRQVIREEAITKEEFEEKIKHLPTKEEFYDSQAKLMKEIKDMREEQAAHMALHTRIDKRLDRVEKKLSLKPLFSG